MELNKLLVVVDPTQDNEALLQRAELIASRSQAQVELFLAEHRSGLDASFRINPQGAQSGVDAYLNSKRVWLESYIERLRRQGIQTQGEVRWAKPLHDAVLDRAAELQADMILKENHHHSLLQRALFTNTDWHLIRGTKVPLWFVKRDHRWNTQPRIMAAVDPMHTHDKEAALDLRILEWSKRFSAALMAQLHVVHVYEVIPTGMMAEFDTMIADYPAIRQEALKHHREALENLMSRSAPNAISYLEDGLPEQVLPAFARDNAVDLTVMGAVSRSGMDRLFVGSTAERVLEDLQSDVLIVR